MQLSLQRRAYCSSLHFLPPQKLPQPLCTQKMTPTAWALLEFTEAPLRILRVSSGVIDIGIPTSTSPTLDIAASCLSSNLHSASNVRHSCQPVCCQPPHYRKMILNRQTYFQTLCVPSRLEPGGVLAGSIPTRGQGTRTKEGDCVTAIMNSVWRCKCCCSKLLHMQCRSVHVLVSMVGTTSFCHSAWACAPTAAQAD